MNSAAAKTTPSGYGEGEVGSRHPLAPVKDPMPPYATKSAPPVAPALLCGLALTGCGGPELQGTVVDPWAHPLEDVQVIVEGVAEDQVTDGQGHFSFEVEPGSTLNLMAGLDGYIKGSASVRIPRGKSVEMPSPSIVLYPDPDSPGFYAVDESGYARLEASPVRSVGTELNSFTGLADIGAETLPAPEPLRVVFATNLRRADISRLDLRLTTVQFVDRRPIKDVYGETDVTVNLWIPTEDVPFDIIGLASSTDYLIQTRAPLKPGAYAFHIQSVLTDVDVHHLERMPREMRVAYPFQVE